MLATRVLCLVLLAGAAVSPFVAGSRVAEARCAAPAAFAFATGDGSVAYSGADRRVTFQASDGAKLVGSSAKVYRGQYWLTVLSHERDLTVIVRVNLRTGLALVSAVERGAAGRNGAGRVSRAMVAPYARPLDADCASLPTATRSASPTRGQGQTPTPTATRGPTPKASPGATRTPTPKPFNSYNCVDFASQADAQGFLRRYPSDPSGLDHDRDGIACEDNPAPFDQTPVARPSPNTPRTR